MPTEHICMLQAMVDFFSLRHSIINKRLVPDIQLIHSTNPTPTTISNWTINAQLHIQAVWAGQGQGVDP